jgi:hypothetical protein
MDHTRRNSRVRASLGLDQGMERLSLMAGLLLRDVTLPFEGYGHVLLGDYGPALVYRISPSLVRVCLDVPLPWRRAPARQDRIFASYASVLPACLARPIRAALTSGPIQWAINGLRPRTHYGEPRIALVGDAVGHVHPMTAAGMTLGFADAEALAAESSVARYAGRRRAHSQSPALLATALYEIFALQSEPTDACRRAIFSMWRRDPSLRGRTMDFLSCTDTSMAHLMRVGLRLVANAGLEVSTDALRSGRVDRGAASLTRVAGLIRWLAWDAVPAPMQFPWARAVTPFAPIRAAQLATAALPRTP